MTCVIFMHLSIFAARYTRVTADNRSEYVRLALNYRLHEFDSAVDAVRDGMSRYKALHLGFFDMHNCIHVITSTSFSRVVPVPLLSLFTGFELETMVCGSPDIPLHLLKSVATYKG